MLIAVVVLAVTTLAALAALAWVLLGPVDHPRPSLSVVRVLDAAPPPDPSSSATRQIITIEILNPVEMAATRGRLAGIAGSLAPGLARRMVYDQAVRLVREYLAAEQPTAVVDVRVHTVGPA